MSFRLQFKKYRRPFKAPLSLPSGEWTEREGILVRLQAEQPMADGGPGIGFGEVAPLPSFGTESLHVAEVFLKNYRGSIGLSEITGVPDRLACTRFALECALEMARGRDRARDSFEGGQALPVAGLLPAGEAALPRMDALLERGFISFKWKVGTGPTDREIEICQALAAKLPAAGRLRIDANACFSTSEAMRWLRVLDELPVDYLEQPLPVGQEAAMKDLSRYYATPIALDESATRFTQIRQLTTGGWTGPLIIKPALLGPITLFRAWRATRICRIVYSSAFETSVGFEAVLRLAASDTREREPAGFGTLEYFPPDDGFSVHEPGPLLQASGYGPDEFEALWDRL
ncbi:MAG: o-succinylbenzoate synthase [Opitutales bacterium]